jgi:hypothetical protein
MVCAKCDRYIVGRWGSRWCYDVTRTNETMTPFRDTALPRSAMILGSVGLTPFILLAIQTATGLPMGAGMVETAREALVIYGAIVMSFLGGIQWGLAVSSADRSDSWRRYGFSVVPTVLACLSVWLGGHSGLVALASALTAWIIYELWCSGLGEAPQWYARLRLGLSVVAVACLVLAATYGPR